MALRIVQPDVGDTADSGALHLAAVSDSISRVLPNFAASIQPLNANQSPIAQLRSPFWLTITSQKAHGLPPPKTAPRQNFPFAEAADPPKKTTATVLAKASPLLRLRSIAYFSHFPGAAWIELYCRPPAHRCSS
jgi:hypothetical protein